MVYVLDKLIYYWYNCSEIEKRLLRYQGYKANSILKWKKNTNLDWKTTIKLLKNIKIFDAIQIRTIIKEIIEQNNILFNQENCYITSFGEPAKSGDIILYDVKHSMKNSNFKIIKPWDIPGLPQESVIIFVDDLIGTGNQSLEYINNKLNGMLNPSHKPYLLCLCATPEGINRLRQNTNFEILCGITLQENSSQFYSNSCKIFNDKEKSNLKTINNLLKNESRFDFDRGLLISFYYSVPNSTMPIIWKDNYKYKNFSGEDCKWFALLPRYY